MTDKALQRLCAKWAKALSLSDWEIKIQFVRAPQMSTADRAGECGHLLEAKKAYIAILDPVDRDEECPEVEATVVHELLHLLMAPFQANEGLERVAQEQAITAITKALIRQVRTTH